MTAFKRAFGSLGSKRLLESSRGKLETCSTHSPDMMVTGAVCRVKANRRLNPTQ
jgi:hypothetical protein